MTISRRCFVLAALIALSAGLANAQVGVISGPANSPLFCLTTAAGVPELRPESYSELVGDIIIVCNGGPPYLQIGTAVPTANIVVYMAPAVPITSRIIGPNGASEVMLIIDEAGANLQTGATGGYGPQAPQSLCTTAQQQNPAGSPCQAYISTDRSGQYQVAVQPGTSTPAQNVYQGKIGDFGLNSVAFYNVPILPPAYQGVSRVFRIANLRVPVTGMNPAEAFQVTISASPFESMPLNNIPIGVGVVGPATTAGVNAAPAGGGNPFLACVAHTSPTLAAQVTFTEGFATAFKTRVVPLTNTAWAATVPNTGTPGQNIPGGLYGSFAANSESGFIVPAANAVISGVTYTAGLGDFGTRLKSVFSNIPAGVALYVSTASSGSYAMPGGTDLAPYAVLVASSQSAEANNDGAAITPLTSAITGSDGLNAYRLTPDSSGTAAAIWEVVDTNPSAEDTFTFSVYVAYSNAAATVNPSNAALSFAPEPGGGSFSTGNATQELSSPMPRFAILTVQQGPWLTINPCSMTASGPSPVSFSYSIGGGAPASQTLSVTTSPNNLAVTATPSVTTPAGGSWLSASLRGGTLTISTTPGGLAASPLPYSGSVKLSAPGVADFLTGVNLTVSPGPVCAVTGDITAGVADVQAVVNQALGIDPPAYDLNSDGVVNVADIQVVINAALGLGCQI